MLAWRVEVLATFATAQFLESTPGRRRAVALSASQNRRQKDIADPRAKELLISRLGVVEVVVVVGLVAKNNNNSHTPNSDSLPPRSTSMHLIKIRERNVPIALVDTVLPTAPPVHRRRRGKQRGRFGTRWAAAVVAVRTSAGAGVCTSGRGGSRRDLREDVSWVCAGWAWAEWC
jgi:hypothetical protein